MQGNSADLLWSSVAQMEERLAYDLEVDGSSLHDANIFFFTFA